MHDGGWAEIGSLTVGLHPSALIQSQTAPRAVDAVFLVRNAASIDLESGDRPGAAAPAARFVRDSAEWIATTRTLQEPALELIMAAPLAPVVAPFGRAARNGIVALLLVTGGVVLVSTYLITRMTGPIVAATRAAEAVAAGRMDHHVPDAGADEIGRLGRAFNAMSRSLRSTLEALATQRAQAVLGEFATSLAHEVRNAHTTIGLDLQRVIRSLDDSAAERAMLERSLGRVRTVDRVVEGALRVARSGHVKFEELDLRQVVIAAAAAASPWFEERDAVLVVTGLQDDAIPIVGDATALETMLLNLLRNAAQALSEEGRAELSVARDGAYALIQLRDEGIGMSAEQLAAAFQLFVTTRPDGTGLGLSIARQIALAHGTDIQIESAPGAGTVCRIRLAVAVE